MTHEERRQHTLDEMSTRPAKVLIRSVAKHGDEILDILQRPDSDFLPGQRNRELADIAEALRCLSTAIGGRFNYLRGELRKSELVQGPSPEDQS